MLSAEMGGLWDWVGGGLEEVVGMGALPEQSGSGGLHSARQRFLDMCMQTQPV